MLEIVNSPNDIKSMSVAELKTLAKDVRQLILDTVLENGGHLASNLGIVECVVAMHYVFDTPEDKFVFDVGHQCYAHKILTGRKDSFSTLRKCGGISGFPKREESVYDVADTGHSSTSISLACGLARAAYHNGSDEEIVTLIGDGALTGGLSFEALNDVNNTKHRQIIILNDNSMSISKNVGSMSKYLMKLHENSIYRSLKSNTVEIIDNLQLSDREKAYSVLYKFRDAVKYFLQGGLPFSQYDIRYLGPIDGNNLEEVIHALNLAKAVKGNVILHVVTMKGRGFLEAEENPGKYHGFSSSSSVGESFSEAFGKKLLEMAKEDSTIYGITAAMSSGTGLNYMQKDLPSQFIDVGIAEAHAVCMSAGLALGGLKPYVAIYSTFLQRAYDQIVHDVCLMDLDVTLCLDRAGIVPDDGATHQGIYDVGFLTVIPNITIAAPKDIHELSDIMEWSKTFTHPLVIRYPKGCYDLGHQYINNDKIELGKWQYLKKEEKAEITVICSGALMCKESLSAHRLLKEKGIDIDVVNARFVKPIDKELIASLNGKKIITVEDNLLDNGLGSLVSAYIIDTGLNIKLKRMGITDEIKEHGKVGDILKKYALSAEDIARCVEKSYET